MTAATTIPGYVVGTWDIDAAHSDVSFSVRHMMVSKVRGRFTGVSGELVTAEKFEDSSVTATVDATSLTTGQEQRDGHIRSADFFDVEKYPEWAFRSTGLTAKGEDFVLAGDLTIKGVTRPVEFDLELGGFGPDAYGGTRAGFTATTTVKRSEFGVDIELPMDGGGVVVGDKISVLLEIEAVLKTA